MKNWEIVRGVAADWKQHKTWWIMSWMPNAPGGPVYPAGPYLVRTFDGTDRLWMSVPAEGRVMFDQEAEPVGRGHGYHIPHSTVWARMPVETPARPNVEMCYETQPWGEGKHMPEQVPA